MCVYVYICLNVCIIIKKPKNETEVANCEWLLFCYFFLKLFSYINFWFNKFADS